MSRISLNQVESSERFYRIPKVFTDENSYYNSMRLESKFAYGLLKDRFELSIQNKWVDKENNVYLIFTVKELEKVLGCKKDKVHLIKKELAKYGLLEEERQGLNKPNRIYVLNVDVTRTSEKPTSKETSDSKDVGNSDIQTSEKSTSRSRINRHQDIYNSDTNDTEGSETDLSDTENKTLDDERKNNKRISESQNQLKKVKRDYLECFPLEKELIESLMKTKFSEPVKVDLMDFLFTTRVGFDLDYADPAQASIAFAELVQEQLLYNKYNSTQNYLSYFRIGLQQKIATRKAVSTVHY